MAFIVRLHHERKLTQLQGTSTPSTSSTKRTWWPTHNLFKLKPKPVVHPTTRGSPRDKKGRIFPRKPYPINKKKKKMQGIGCNYMPPSGGSPKRDDDGSRGFLCNKLYPKKSGETKKTINPTIILAPIITESVDTWSPPAPMQEGKHVKKAVFIWRKYIESMGPPSYVQPIKERTTNEQQIV